ncbi:hypothetical protein PoB_004025700 [Plakobranchus ocellatus]|uniref:Uncharacterized protein n=1 Tax=Plakobranchus ocellatus TaxID=259542 RepID=A0AAV4B3E9_9GAST|nr:hypothetical protein PoB_004025700 [Plakobranchus ocellatus]
MRGHVTAPPFPLSDRAADVRPGCKTQRIAPTLRQVADLMCVGTKEREYFKTCIVGHVNCCLQCGPTLSRRCELSGSICAKGVTRNKRQPWVHVGRKENSSGIAGLDHLVMHLDLMVAASSY